MQDLIEEYDKKGLFYFFLIDNLKSILRHGILPKNMVNQLNLNYRSFAHETVQGKRHNKQVRLSTGRVTGIHDLVPLYFTSRTPTLYSRRHLSADLCFAVISTQKILLDQKIEFAFTDGNAASGETCFYHASEYLDKIPWAVIRAAYWNEFEDGLRKRNAEFLIYPMIDIHKIDWLVVNSDVNRKRIEEILELENIHSIKVANDPTYFFEFS